MMKQIAYVNDLTLVD